MNNVNWDEVQDEIRKPVPGGYAAKITNVKDEVEKEYLLIEWEFAEGEFKGANREVFDTFGFWPMSFFCSYKPKALRFFKGFKTAVECSNRGYVFNNDPQSLVGKYFGVVLGEEEYISKKGELKTRLYVAEKRSGKAIRDGDYTVPGLKKLVPGTAPRNSPGTNYPPVQDYSELEGDDGELPF